MWRGRIGRQLGELGELDGCFVDWIAGRLVWMAVWLQCMAVWLDAWQLRGFEWRLGLQLGGWHGSF